LRKAEILSLTTEHARLSTAFAEAEEQVRAGKEERERLRGELALYPDPTDPAVRIATIDQAKSLGDTDQVAKLAETLDDLHCYREAEKVYRETLTIQQRVIGPIHADTANTKHNIA
jgi:hypothetical protein